MNAVTGEELLIVVDGRSLLDQGTFDLDVSSCSPVSESLCGNGADDDLDGLTDCADPDCAATAVCLGGEDCTNGSDDDGDGDVDCLDPDCFQDPFCQSPEDCTNGVDDDNVNGTDCADLACFEHPACSSPCPSSVIDGAFVNGQTTGATDDFSPSCVSPSPARDVALEWLQPGVGCWDLALSNTTFDAVLDVRQGGCNTSASVACSAGAGGLDPAVRVVVSDPAASYLVVIDGRDVTQAGDFDLAITPCQAAVEVECANGLDDDNDGQTDCADPDCFADPACGEFRCGDGSDNDGNGAFDCDDPACATTCSRGNQSICADEVIAIDPAMGETYQGTTVGSGDRFEPEPGCGGGSGGNDWMVEWQPPFEGCWEAQVVGIGSDPLQDSILSVYDAFTCPAAATDPVECNDDAAGLGGNSRVTFDAIFVDGTPTPVTVVVDGFNNREAGEFELSFLPCPGPENSPQACSDGYDNDRDSLADCNDPGCTTLNVCAELCDDPAADANGNGDFGCADTTCLWSNVCLSGLDGDTDGLTVERENALGSSDSNADSDNDGLPDFEDSRGGYGYDTDGDGTPDILDPDADGDGVNDGVDSCPWTPNAGDSDSDGDGVGDACDGPGPEVCASPTDYDGDGLAQCTDPDCVVGPYCTLYDGDDDGLSAGQEAALGTSDNEKDSDFDGVDDGIEAPMGFAVDTDFDGVIDALDTDSDGDLVSDGLDNCRTTTSSDFLDTDNDGKGAPCDEGEFICYVESGDEDGDGYANCQDVDCALDVDCSPSQEWFCDPIFISDGTCDCGCGALDPDCGQAIDPGVCERCPGGGQGSPSCGFDPNAPGACVGLRPDDNRFCTQPEICDNLRDDDGNGVSDCADPVCSGTAACDTSRIDRFLLRGQGSFLIDMTSADYTVPDCAGSATGVDQILHWVPPTDGCFRLSLDGTTGTSNAELGTLTSCLSGTQNLCEANPLGQGPLEFFPTSSEPVEIVLRDVDGTATEMVLNIEECFGEFSVEFCANGSDDDGDGAADCLDPDCTLFGGCEPENCTNGIDDNGNGLIDCEEPICLGSDPACAEDCTNGIDDNGNGLVDCFDPYCGAEPVCNQAEICGNTIDDDFDGAVDCDDVDCQASCTTSPVEVINDCPAAYCVSNTIGSATTYTYTIPWHAYPVADDVGPGGCFLQQQATNPELEIVLDTTNVVEVSATTCTSTASDSAVVIVDGPLELGCNDDFSGDPTFCSRVPFAQTASNQTVVSVDEWDLDSYWFTGDGFNNRIIEVTLETAGEICWDGTDNDGNGFIDCTDAACASSAACLSSIESDCANLVDDDGDVLIDCADSDCWADASCDTGTEICGNGVDDDANGFTDCTDAACATVSPCTGTGEAFCGDLFDNDGDGLIDCADSDCTTDPACNTSAVEQIIGCDPTWCSQATGPRGGTLYTYTIPAGEHPAVNDVDSTCVGNTGGSDVLVEIDLATSGALGVAVDTCFGPLNLDASVAVFDGSISSLGTEVACEEDRRAYAMPVEYCAQVVTNSVGSVATVVVDEFQSLIYWDDSAARTFTIELLPPEICGDFIDNDGNGAADCIDFACISDPACDPTGELCGTVGDEDSDGYADCADDECISGFGCEYPEISCADGQDNDGNGLIDCADDHCFDDPVCGGSSGSEICFNGVDDDGANGIDCADPACTSSPACSPVETLLGCDPAFCELIPSGGSNGGDLYVWGFPPESHPSADDHASACDSTATVDLEIQLPEAASYPLSIVADTCADAGATAPTFDILDAGGSSIGCFETGMDCNLTTATSHGGSSLTVWVDDADGLFFDGLTHRSVAIELQ